MAAAVEAFLAGADVIDEIQDGDPSPLVDTAGLPQALNAGAALLVLAHDILSRLDGDGVPRDRVPRFLQTLSRGALQAAGGQHLDLAAEGSNRIGTADAFAIVQGKAGALGGMASCLGGLVGTNDQRLLNLYEAFGAHVGSIAQITNDLCDVQCADHKTDLVRGKSTLPIVYSQSLSRDLSAQRRGLTSDHSVDAEVRAFVEVVLEVELFYARAVIDELSDLGQDVAPLVELLG